MTRKSRRELERAIEDWDVGSEYPEAGIITILSADECEPADPDRGLYRINGEVMYVHPDTRGQLTEEDA